MRNSTLEYIDAGVPINCYEIVVVDEAQDLCALQAQIAFRLVSPQTNAISFVGDSTQRIYKNNYLWQDIQINFAQNRLELHKNFRNTKEIASVAESLMRFEEDQSDIDILEPSLTFPWVQNLFGGKADFYHRRNSCKCNWHL
ncbi:MAG: UvrD-helicase domain-containing protein [Caldilineaceae bacterium]